VSIAGIDPEDDGSKNKFDVFAQWGPKQLVITIIRGSSCWLTAGSCR